MASSNKSQYEINKPRTSRSTLGTVQWFFQALSGIFLIFFVGVHLYVAHINGGTPVALFDSVIRNLHNPWWLAFFIVFVWIITYHALNGVKGILYDMGLSQKGKKYVSYAITGVYIVTVIYGTILAVIVAGMTVP